LTEKFGVSSFIDSELDDVSTVLATINNENERKKVKTDNRK